MDKIKSVLISIIVIAVIILVPTSIFTDFFKFIGEAIKWVVFIDNKETGLPFIAEIFIKGIIEGIIVLIASCYGIKERNLIVSLIIIIAGFIACVAFYFICEYIIWILVILAVIIILIISINILVYYKNKSNNKVIE